METDQDFVDQQLLQQFRCMGTTDKDELIKQFKMLVGNHVGTPSAIFLLDMNDWNLQAAVGSYFDFDMTLKIPSMSFIRDEDNSNVFKITPSTMVNKVWDLFNDGDDAWPPGVHLVFAGGDKMSQFLKMPVPSIGPKEVTKVIVNLFSPAKPGIYKSEWRMITPGGTYFGDIIWVIMTVLDEEPTSLITQLSNLNTSSDTVDSTPSNVIVNNFGDFQ